MSKFKIVGLDIVDRCPDNPIITIENLSFHGGDIWNAGVVRFAGEVVLLVTIESPEGRMAVHLARRRPDGPYEVDEKPFMEPVEGSRNFPHECKGIQDARVTFLDGLHYIMYLAFGDHGYRLGLAKTKDFSSVEYIDLVSEPDTKGGALFPGKIGGRYARLERPGEGRSIWVSYSDDLIYWGGSQRVISPRGGFWDSSWVGVGAPPIEIEEGWLLLYYGAKDTSAGPIYRIGAAILDKENPKHLRGRTNVPILTPRERYERLGDTRNMVFTAGALLDDNGNIDLYYGAADSCICLGTTTLTDIRGNCEASEEEF